MIIHKMGWKQILKEYSYFYAIRELTKYLIIFSALHHTGCLILKRKILKGSEG